MDKLYYQPNHLWKGKAAVKKLAELSGEKPKTVKQWLSRQAFWQVHLPAYIKLQLYQFLQFNVRQKDIENGSSQHSEI